MAAVAQDRQVFTQAVAAVHQPSAAQVQHRHRVVAATEQHQLLAVLASLTLEVAVGQWTHREQEQAAQAAAVMVGMEALMPD